MLHVFRDRKKTYVIWVVVVVGTILSFIIGFNFLFGTGAGTQGAPTDDLGSVAGEHITREQFEATFRRNLDSYRQQSGREPDDATLAYMRDQTWSNLVGQLALDREAAKLGLGANDREVVFAVKNMPPQEVMSAPAFQTNGQFDMRKYRQLMSDPSANAASFWTSVESYTRSQLPQQKLQTLGASLAKITDDELESAYARTNDKATIQLISFPTREDTVDARTISQADLKAYFDKHQDDFRRDDEADLVIALIQKTSTDLDARNAGDNARSLYQEAVKDSDFAKFATQNSDEQVPSLTDGKPGRLVEMGQLYKSLEAVVFALKPGEISQPVLSEGAWHIVKYIGQVQDAGKSKRHIIDLVVSVKPSNESIEAIRTRLEKVRDDAVKVGLQAAASRAQLEVHKTGWFTQDEPPGALAQLNDIVTFAFSVKKGSLSHVVDKPGAMLLVQVVDRRPAGVRSLSEVDSEVRALVAKEQMLDRAGAKARKALEVATRTGSMEEAAKAAGRTVGLPPVFTRSGPFGPDIGGEPRIIGTAFGAPVGSVRLVRGELGAYIIKVTGKAPYDAAKFQTEQQTLRQDLLRRKQQELMQTWVRQIQKTAKIQDLRPMVGS